MDRPDVLRAAAIFAFVLAVVPALPHLTFAATGAALLFASQAGVRRHEARTASAAAAREAGRRAAIRRPEMALGLVGVDALAIDFGHDLGPLLLAPLADALLDRIGEVRRAIAADIGIVMPGVRLRDDFSRDGGTYAIRVRDVIVGSGALRLERLLAVADEAILATLAGERVREPVYGMTAVWLAPSERERATSAGALVFDPVSVIGSHLAEVVRTNAAALLGRQELHTLVEHLRATVPSLVKELGTDALSFATVHRVFESLLAEGVWPRDAVATLESLVDASTTTRDPRELVQAVRRRIVPLQLRRRASGALEPLIVEPDFERDLTAWLADGALAPQPEFAVHVRGIVGAYLTRVPRERAALLCGAPLRAPLAEFLARFGLRVDVFAYAELPAELDVRPALVLERPVPAAPLAV